MLAWTGLPQLVLIPLVPLLMRRFDPRLLVGVGLALFAASCFMNMRHRPATIAALSSSCRTWCVPSARRWS